MLLPIAVMILACGAHALTPEQEASKQTDCCNSCTKEKLAKKHLSAEEELLIEEGEEAQDGSQEERHIVTLADPESSES